MRTQTELQFDEYRRNAPEGSDRWAASDRGWAWVGRLEGRESGVCFANYLRYDHGKHYDKNDPKNVHVVIVGRGVVWVRTCADARLAIRKAFKRASRQ